MHRLIAALFASLVLAGCASGSPAREATVRGGFFQRYTDADPPGLERDIETARSDLSAARARGDQRSALRIAADLGGMLTTARREQEARAILATSLDEARQLDRSETLGWLVLNLATANQYLHRRTEAAAQFLEALEIARSLSTLELEHYALQHRGRFLVEAGEIERARACFSRALELRVRLKDPLQASSRRALDALDAREHVQRR